jgi:RNA polymerase sigma factor (TIGR02999 family)
MVSDPEITQLLRAWGEGDDAALEELTPLIYDELHKLAMRVFSGERANHTLQPTALVNEAYENLVKIEVAWQDRAHFFALSARMMRRMLVNHAAARNAQKRGGGALSVTLNDAVHGGSAGDPQIEDLDEALNELAELDPRKADLIELQYFAGLTFAEMEVATGMSSSTLDRHLRTARAWLKSRLSDTG